MRQIEKERGRERERGREGEREGGGSKIERERDGKGILHQLRLGGHENLTL